MSGESSVIGSSRKRRRGRNKFRKSKKSLVLHDPHHSSERNKVYKSIVEPVENGKQSSDSTAKKRKSCSLLEKMRARLSGGHFRMLNEKLYNCTGKEALDYFKEDPALFDVYHVGYQEQMSHWPEQPVNLIIKWLQRRDSSLVVADFGCGDACLSRNVKNTVFSFDLVSIHSSVIACDMSNTPLDFSSVDVAVFCLSLMGTNFSCYLKEADRVLKPGGWLLIAEVKSRFDPNTGGADLSMFINAVCDMGFSNVQKDMSNKMFILLYFMKKKQGPKKSNIKWPELKPCVYKRR